MRLICIYKGAHREQAAAYNRGLGSSRSKAGTSTTPTVVANYLAARRQQGRRHEPHLLYTYGLLVLAIATLLSRRTTVQPLFQQCRTQWQVVC
jgi:hypothetical protein